MTLWFFKNAMTWSIHKIQTKNVGPYLVIIAVIMISNTLLNTSADETYLLTPGKLRKLWCTMRKPWVKAVPQSYKAKQNHGFNNTPRYSVQIWISSKHQMFQPIIELGLPRIFFFFLVKCMVKYQLQLILRVKDSLFLWILLTFCVWYVSLY